jgi:hypothetical protein
LSLVAAGALVLLIAHPSQALNADAEPAALAKQRGDLYVKATQAPLAKLESDLNHLAVLSEACRVAHGAQACGLPDKPLESGKLEDRFGYYVKGPVEAHSKTKGLKVNRGNWAGSSPHPR